MEPSLRFDWTALSFALTSIAIVGSIILARYIVKSELDARYLRLKILAELAVRRGQFSPGLVIDRPPRSTWGPLLTSSVLFALVTGFLGYFVIGIRILSPLESRELLGMQWANQLLTVMFYTFVPAYFCALARIHFAAMSADLEAKHLIDSTAGIVLSCIGSVILWQVASVFMPPDTLTSSGTIWKGILAVALFVGFVPILSLLRPLFISQSTRSLWDIAGIERADIARLNSLGISNMHSLASVDPLDLFLSTRYEPLTIVNWIAQAQLKARFDYTGTKALEELHIRTILEFSEFLEKNPDRAYAVIRMINKARSEDTPIFEGVPDVQILRADPSFKALDSFRRAIDAEFSVVEDPAMADTIHTRLTSSLLQKEQSTAALPSSVGGLEERLGKIEDLIAGPVLDNYQGFVCVDLTSDNQQLLPDDTGLPVMRARQAGIVEVWFSPDRSNCSFQESITIRNGNDTKEVKFDIALDSDTIEFENGRKTVTIGSKPHSERLLFKFFAPKSAGRHDVWIRVSQKNRLVQVVAAALRVIDGG